MKLHIAAIIALTATTASAGNLVTEGLDDPHVMPPPVSVTSWGGAYVGASIGASRETSSHQEHDSYMRECARGEGKWGGKCTVDQSDWDQSPELLALGEPLDGHPSRGGDLSTNFRYDAGYPGVWVADEPLRYTSNSNEEMQSRYAQNTVVGDVFRTFTDEAEDTTYGVHAGYRHGLSESFYVGAEVGAMSGDEALATAELTASVAAGSMLFTVSGGYAQLGDEEGGTYGVAADYLIGNMTVGAKAYQAEFDQSDVTGVALRVGFNF